ASGRALA
nr:pep7 protein [Tellina virus 1]